jgi:hypothetical protein
MAGIAPGPNPTSACIAARRELLNLVPMDMSSVKKRDLLAVLNLLIGHKWLRLPTNIKGISNQFLKYRLPDEKLTKDIVSAFLVFAGLLWRWATPMRSWARRQSKRRRSSRYLRIGVRGSQVIAKPERRRLEFPTLSPSNDRFVLLSVASARSTKIAY